MDRSPKITHDVLVKLSIGMLITMGSGLIAGTAKIVTLSDASEQHASRLSDHDAELKEIHDVKTAIAVLQEKVDRIDKKLDQ